MKDGVYQRLLTAGKHRFFSKRGYQVLVVNGVGQVDTKEIPIQVLRQEKQFAEQTAYIQVPDDCIALHYVDGQFCDVLTGKEYLFWNRYQKHTFRLVSIRNPEVEPDFPRYLFQAIPTRFYRKVEVAAGEVALLYFDNRLQRQLTSGTYYFWNWETKVNAVFCDLKTQQLEISGQEILTKDKVGVRLNLVCTYQITDPVALQERVQDLKSQLYAYIQLTVREYVGRFRLDELLEQRDEISRTILTALSRQQKDFCVAFRSAGIKDIILPGEIREIMNTVLVAEKTAQANVITRREEVASTRSLLNTARLMEENQTLYKLKELEYLERICDRVGSISLSGANNVLEQLRELVTVK